jgi:hypothetical protein
VSGVYYASVPANAGPIVFEDPRGPLPPFSNRFFHRPREGEMVLFPSWLVHFVAPTKGNEPRVSFSFNQPGQWTSTSDVSAVFPADTE